ncbi:RNA polymerase sigma factor [Aeromicrobium massiliense]|uniref:RNA polymerase sigma factor n=1 Tax=Aeromicrobium massiliense TaxID=1464554 RepID=UPI000304133A|nr:sigma-70 family RNA polymerase sigma factor [Aeromicrobium massiliense]
MFERRPSWERDFEAFFLARRRLYLRIAYTIVGDWQRAEDATQDTFSSLYAKWTTIRGREPDPFARKVLVNACLRILRQRRRGNELPSEPEALDVVRHDDPDAALSLDLSAALATLSPQHRAVVALRYLHDLSVAEVAATLRVPEGTVKSQSARGLDALRAHLERSGSDPVPALRA